MKTILIADDDKNIRELIKYPLIETGYDVIEAVNGEQALALAEQQLPDLVVIDIMMPLKDGYEVARTIRAERDIPLIMLTAKGELANKAEGFLAGIDDYMTKPFATAELLFRIKALFRRYDLSHETTVEVGNLVIDRRTYAVTHQQTDIFLPLKEFELLYELASHPGWVYTREDLISRIWGAAYEGNDRTVDVHIKRLREHLGENTAVAIVTMRGLGYKLEVIV
ncbi:response regulator transcription factor [Brochothrix campestris]|uniref:Heme response regulator HssR n=1 Tax=Brochothrix campestris FSL F6-1037 TaxID=1265861 RepID=W7D197_9LIST|nr:response regulator transcription factor [Brochothrix campestris]EUJ39083.1 winged helix family two component transcriptional regulator [Brochothrix campestris FSL F6-1037]